MSLDDKFNPENRGFASFLDNKVLDLAQTVSKKWQDLTCISKDYLTKGFCYASSVFTGLSATGHYMIKPDIRMFTAGAFSLFMVWVAGNVRPKLAGGPKENLAALLLNPFGKFGRLTNLAVNTGALVTIGSLIGSEVLNGNNPSMSLERFCCLNFSLGLLAHVGAAYLSLIYNAPQPKRKKRQLWKKAYNGVKSFLFPEPDPQPVPAPAEDYVPYSYLPNIEAVAY